MARTDCGMQCKPWRHYSARFPSHKLNFELPASDLPRFALLSRQDEISRANLKGGIGLVYQYLEISWDGSRSGGESDALNLKLEPECRILFRI